MFNFKRNLSTILDTLANGLLMMMFASIWIVNSVACADDSVSKTFDTLASARSYCYQDARLVKTSFKISDKRYVEAERRFEGVRAAADAWIDQARLRIVQGKSLSDSSLKETATHFADAEQSFRAYVAKLFEEKGKPKGSIVSAIKVLGPVMGEFVDHLYIRYKESSDEERDKLMGEFERVRFASFKQI